MAKLGKPITLSKVRIGSAVNQARRLRLRAQKRLQNLPKATRAPLSKPPQIPTRVNVTPRGSYVDERPTRPGFHPKPIVGEADKGV